MGKTLRSLILALLLAAPGFAVAGPDADGLAKCLVASTSPADRTALVRWMFGLITLHPDLASLSAITPQQRDELSRNAAAIFQRLLLTSCRSQTQQALVNEGPQTVQYAFQALGQTAIQGLIANPQVANGAKDLIKYIDMSQVMTLLAPTPQN